MNTQTVGAKEIVKKGELKAIEVIQDLVDRATRENGEAGVRILKRTKTFRWLSRRHREGK